MFNKQEKKLWEACIEGKVEDVIKLLQNSQINTNWRNQSQYLITPVYIACYEGHLEIVKLLLNDNRVDVNKTDKFDQTPLYIACKNGHIEVVKVLLNDNRVDVNKANNYNQSPFYIACWNGHIGVVKLLLNDQRVDISKRDDNGKTGLDKAKRKENIDTVELIESFQRNPNGTRTKLRKELELLDKEEKRKLEEEEPKKKEIEEENGKEIERKELEEEEKKRKEEEEARKKIEIEKKEEEEARKRKEKEDDEMKKLKEEEKLKLEEEERKRMEEEEKRKLEKRNLEEEKRKKEEIEEIEEKEREKKRKEEGERKKLEEEEEEEERKRKEAERKKIEEDERKETENKERERELEEEEKQKEAERKEIERKLEEEERERKLEEEKKKKESNYEIEHNGEFHKLKTTAKTLPELENDIKAILKFEQNDELVLEFKDKGKYIILQDDGMEYLREGMIIKVLINVNNECWWNTKPNEKTEWEEKGFQDTRYIRYLLRDNKQNVVDNENEYLKKLETLMAFFGGDMKQVNKAYALFNEKLFDSFQHHRPYLFKQQRANPGMFNKDDWKNGNDVAQKSKFHNHYIKLTEDFDWNDSKFLYAIPMIHGTSETALNEICQTGLAATGATNSDGFYGQGMYFSSSLFYSSKYTQISPDGKPFLICMITPGNVYPVTESPYLEGPAKIENPEGFIQKPCQLGYQSHYTLVDKNNDTHPITGNIDGNVANEMVVFDKAQVLPLFAIYFSSTIPILASNFVELEKQPLS